MRVYVAIFALCLMLGLPSQCFKYIVSDSITGFKETQKYMLDAVSHPKEYATRAWRDMKDFSQFPDKSKGPQKEYTWQDLKGLDGEDNRHLCLVLSCNVYDFTDFSDFHPAGPRVLKEYVGRDATDGFKDCGLKPSDIDFVLKRFLVGYVEEDENGLCYEQPSGKFNESGPAVL